MSALLQMPLYLSLLIVFFVGFGIAVLSMRLIKYKLAQEFLRENHDVAGFIFNSFTMMYAVLISFVVFINWSEYDKAQQNIFLETGELSKIFTIASGFPDSLKKEIQYAVLNYSDKVANQEWDLMKYAKRSEEVNIAYDKLWSVFLKMDINKLPNPMLYQESLTRLNVFSEKRRLRYQFMYVTIPGIVWFVVLISAAISSVFTYFFGMKNKIPHYLMGIAYTVVNAMILFLIYVLDHPFANSILIGNETFLEIIKHFQKVMSAM
ncbi:MAG: DUF4239 domain-containing protein [Ignavibacteriae bacterium]|nr:DUF4239 domain-containing protein [Ignavibacteriota bacterium]